MASALIALGCTRAGAEPWSEWTVVTLALDGSWGTGTADSQSAAIASALRKCNAMAGAVNDCGAEFTAIKSGWTIGFLCGEHRVLAAATDHFAAEQQAEDRKRYLATHYGTGFPPCRHIVTIDPDGFVVRTTGPGAKAVTTFNTAPP